MKDFLISVVLPAYNEAFRLEKCVRELRRILKGKNYEIIIAEDGSTDGTDKIAEKIAKNGKNIHHLHHDEKLGRGLALKNAFSICKGNILLYIDVDMSTDIDYLDDLIDLGKKYDVVTGSRYLSQSVISRPMIRRIFSEVYNLLVRVLIGCQIYDSQCGFKAFSKKFFIKEIRKIEEKSWAWDTIVMVVGMKNGYKVKEFPIEWKEKKNKKTSIRRLFGDVKIHGRVLLKLFLKYRLGVNSVVL
jgi:hypothetical protein